ELESTESDGRERDFYTRVKFIVTRHRRLVFIDVVVALVCSNNAVELVDWR
ncbi:hypothetical protein U1Q18_051161, partial [Sarracenia purpurea var. burkii]